MDLKTVAVTFVTIFFAELGDKTQLGVFGLAGSSSSKLSVFLGASAALIASTAVAVVAGEAVTQAVPPVWLERAAGALFVVLGLLFLVRAQ
ncbi:MAG: TMEM165/GDT1 family protein [Myxococcales bacterium]|nr:TMEM165/GDT1 family protein [Myxococcales bacterium]